jgi:hypothetical protein
MEAAFLSWLRRAYSLFRMLHLDSEEGALA